MTSRASSPLKIKLKVHDTSDDPIENKATNAAALAGVFGIPASLRITACTGGALATANPLMINMVTCIVKATRSQNPAPNHCAVCAGELPIETLAVATISTATIAKA